MKWVIIDVNMFHCSVLWLCHSSWRFPDKTMKSASVNLELLNSRRSNPKSDRYFLKICPILLALFIQQNTVKSRVRALLHSSWCYPDKTMKSASVNLELSNSGRSDQKSDLKIFYFLKTCIIFVSFDHTTKYCKVASRIISLLKVSLQIFQKSNSVTNHLRPSIELVCFKKQQQKEFLTSFWFVE